MNNRSTFGSVFGTVVVVGGSVVGLGNIWRFPYLAGENGGAAFIIVYILMSLFISIPIMLTEMSIGRAGQAGGVDSYRKLSKGKFWKWAGALGVFTAFIIMSFYNVIAGWAISFFGSAANNEFAGKTPEMLTESFTSFISSGYQPTILALVFIVLSGIIVMMGVTKGIEKANKILMPLMVVILISMAIYSTTLSGWSEGVTFLLKPDFSKITWKVALEALGQSFFSMSLGMGAMVIYGSYIKKTESMFKVAGMVAITDVLIAVLAGMAIFPAVFSFGIEPGSGAGLVFLTLPNVFAQMAGGQILAMAFFALLFFAAITSSVSLLEVMVAFVHEEFKIKRGKSTLLVMGVLAITSTLCVLSQMPGSSLTILGMDLVDFNDALSATILMPVGALLAVIFAGWYLKKHTFMKEISSSAKYKYRYIISTVFFLVRYVVPLVIITLITSLIIEKLS